MSQLSRRTFVGATAAGLLGASAGLRSLVASDSADLRIAPFRFDVSPPLGHPCCGGWITPVVGYDDPQGDEPLREPGVLTVELVVNALCVPVRLPSL